VESSLLISSVSLLHSSPLLPMLVLSLESERSSFFVLHLGSWLPARASC